MKSLMLLFAMLLLPSMSAAALQPSDFAFGIPLSLDEDGAVYRLTVPRDVYAGVVEGDLEDLRVFNGADAVVPHILRRPEAQADLSETARIMPIFPLFGSGNEDEKFSVRIEKENGSAVINIDSEGEGDDERKCLGYILDLGSDAIRIDAIDLQWPEDAKDFVATVSVAYSEDLTNWSPLVSHATVANMAFGGHRIIRRRIELGAGGFTIPARQGKLTSRRRVKMGASAGFLGARDSERNPMVAAPGNPAYLRLMWDAGVAVTEIKAIRRAGEAIDPENRWTTVQGTCNRQESTSDKTVYEYDSSALYPVDKVRLQFSEKNTLVTAGIFSRSDDTEPWRYRQGGILYNLGEDAVSLVQDTVSVEPISDRYWRVEIVGGTSGDAGGVPVLELGWIPHDLFFVARGDGPFMLVYGSARLGNEVSPGGMPELLTAMAKKDAEKLLKTATPGTEVELGGVGQRIPAPPPLPWKKWVLWGVLVIGVGIIAWMTVSLGRGMGNGGSLH